MLITKSAFLTGLNCPRCFWKAINEKNVTLPSIGELFRIEQGKKVGELAKKRFDNGIDLSTLEITANIENTKSYMNYGRVIFEAGFAVDNLYARVDILVPNGDGFDIIEVKSGSEEKEDYIYDTAFQKYVCTKAGVNIKDCYVLYINNKYIKKGEIDINEFFIQQNINEKVDEIIKDIPKVLEELMKIGSLSECPKITLDKHILKDYSCELGSECWDFLPEHNVNNLYRIRKTKSVEYFRKGIFKLLDVPDGELNNKQVIQKNATKNNECYINKDGIQKFLNSLVFPIYYFDFETFAEALPRFDNTTPYRQVPFQFSLHVEDENNNIKHFEFLHRKNCDPRLEILQAMKDVLGDSGSIVVFYEAFEKTRLKELALDYPEYQEWVNSILERIVDLNKPFANFDYYNPKQKGSCSIKKVLPCITGKGYDGLEIANGEVAYISYMNATFESRMSKEESLRLYNNLLTYCKLDTEGMVWIVEELRKIIR